MARTDNLSNYLTDVASAIKTKKGDSTPIQASNFDTEIINLPSGGGSSHDWTQMGYSSEPTTIGLGFNRAKEIYDNWTSSSSLHFSGDKTIIFLPLIDTSNITSGNKAFQNCLALIEIPLINTSNVTNFTSFVDGCRGLKTFPPLNASKATSMSNMFGNCLSLTEQSLDNILQMCISATVYTGTKTLRALGITSSAYPVATIQALPHYQNFINAGWTIGY